MRKPSFLETNNHTTETTWDSLKEVPFRGEIDSPLRVKEQITDKLINLRRAVKRSPMSVGNFMLFLIGDIQPILATNNVDAICTDYDYWKKALGEIMPILAGFWAECDPMLIHYMFLIFVSQFIVILELWEKRDFSSVCIPDCATMGEFFMIDAMTQEEILSGIMKKWGIKENDDQSF